MISPRTGTQHFIFGGPALAWPVMLSLLISLLLTLVGMNYAPTEGFEFVMAGFATGAVAQIAFLLVVFEVVRRV